MSEPTQNAVKSPWDTPLESWPIGWLKLEVAGLLDDPRYIVMHDFEKENRKYPVIGAEMIAFIKARRTAPNPEEIEG